MRDEKGRFIKGYKPPQEYIEANRKAHLGTIPTNKGVPLTSAQRKKISISNTGRKQSDKEIQKRIKSNTGKKRSDNFKKQLSILYTGSGNPMWRGGISMDRYRYGEEAKKHRIWRKKVFERDDYTCVKCLQRGGRLNADHIKPYALFPKIRWHLSNGQTLCTKCHGKKTSQEHKKYWRNQHGKSNLLLPDILT